MPETFVGILTFAFGDFSAKKNFCEFKIRNKSSLLKVASFLLKKKKKERICITGPDQPAEGKSAVEKRRGWGDERGGSERTPFPSSLCPPLIYIISVLFWQKNHYVRRICNKVEDRINRKILHRLFWADSYYLKSVDWVIEKFSLQIMSERNKKNIQYQNKWKTDFRNYTWWTIHLPTHHYSSKSIDRLSHAWLSQLWTGKCNRCCLLI